MVLSFSSRGEHCQNGIQNMRWYHGSHLEIQEKKECPWGWGTNPASHMPNDHSSWF